MISDATLSLILAKCHFCTPCRAGQPGGEPEKARLEGGLGAGGGLWSRVLRTPPRCPCCSVAQPVFSKLWTTDAIAGEDGGPGRAWGTFQCRTCGSVVLAEGGRGASLANANVEKLFPSLRSIDEAAPARTRNYLQQAHETLHAPDAAAVICRGRGSSSTQCPYTSGPVIQGAA